MMELCDVQLNLPKFKLEETYDLKSTLSSMGMSEAFNQSKADFSGMSSERNLFLSSVFHKCFVEINEQGTEAAAGTGSEVSVRINLPSIEFNEDHPFLFFIRHNKTNSIPSKLNTSLSTRTTAKLCPVSFINFAWKCYKCQVLNVQKILLLLLLVY